MQWATPSTDVDTNLPESVVEFLDFQAHQTQAEHFSSAISIKCLVCRGRRSTLFFCIELHFPSVLYFFPTMVQFAFGIVVPFSLSEALTSYQATCSENKSVLRGHYVNREYKPDVSPKIYI